MARKAHVITEGNLRAVQDFREADMWHFHIMDTKGFYANVQWMHKNNIQYWFKTPIPAHKDIVNETF